MGHECDPNNPQRCINPDGSYCHNWERRIGKPIDRGSDREIPSSDCEFVYINGKWHVFPKEPAG